MTDDSSRAPLWDDNPSEIDLLGFDAVVAPIVDATLSKDLDPLTIGVHARWGGGKSTILNLIAGALADQTSVVVIRTSPWEYDDHDDVKGSLISEVLDALQQSFKDDASLTAKVTELLGRISWARVGKAIVKGAASQRLDLPELAKALTPKPRESVESMAGFKSSFADLVGSLEGIDRVVVLVDDLDRCMPSAVTATLEGIKLFLSVPGMVFVIAADQDMVRDAIAMNLGGSVETSRFAQRYLEKIVQLPVSLPVLPVHEADAYLGLLLSKSELNDADFLALVAHAQGRRATNTVPLLADMDGLTAKPSDDVLRLATQLVHGLRSDKVVNPREIKRFLNAFQIRKRIAEVRGVDVRPDVLAKLLLLEDRFKTDFETLAFTPDLERGPLLQAWQDWAKDEDKDKPDGVSPDSRDWAAADPDLASEAIGPYLTLAASFAVIRQAGVAIDAELAALIGQMAGDSEVLRRTAVESLVQRSEEDQRTGIESLLGQARLHEDGGRIISSLIGIAHAAPTFVQEISTGLKENCWKQIDVGNAVDLATSTAPAFQHLARELTEDDSIDPEVAQAAKNVLDGEGS